MGDDRVPTSRMVRLDRFRGNGLKVQRARSDYLRVRGHALHALRSQP